MTHAQVLLRAYARATNMLIAGRRFVTSDPELASLLEAFGAQVITPDWSEEAPSTPTGLDVIFDLDEFTPPTHPQFLAPETPDALRGHACTCL